MNNYTTLEEKTKEEIVTFIKKLTLGLGKVDTRFITDVTLGILNQNSIILSDIVRKQKAVNVNIKKGVERLERHLDRYNEIEEMISSNYTDMIKPYINGRHIYFVDRGDIVKDASTKFENKGYVLDGSDEHKIKQGYQINEIVTIDNANQPISLISELRSANDEDYKSDNELWLTHMRKVSKIYGKGTFVCDRAYDSGIIMEKILQNGDDFIIRGSRLNRNVYVKGKKTTIRKIASSIKGYYNFCSNYKGKTQRLKVSYKQIVIKNDNAKDLENYTLNLVIVKGFNDGDEKQSGDPYMALITSRKISTKEGVIQIVRDYLTRWKIEENFKYKKQQFKLEKIMVRRYKRIQNINKLLTMIMFFGNVINTKGIGKAIRKIKKQIREKISFWLYRISNGIKELISFFSVELMLMLYPKGKKRRRDLWTVMGVAFR